VLRTNGQPVTGQPSRKAVVSVKFAAIVVRGLILLAFALPFASVTSCDGKTARTGNVSGWGLIKRDAAIVTQGEGRIAVADWAGGTPGYMDGGGSMELG
jgi:hypothetical protein